MTKAKVIALLFGQIGSFSQLFNLQSKSINFNSGHLSSKPKGYSLTFWPILVICHQNWLLFTTVQFSSKSNNFNSGHGSSKTKGYSFTFWPNLAHFHHCLISNHNQSISNLVICHDKAKVIALLFVAIFNLAHFHHLSISNQNQSISILVIFHQQLKVIALRFGQNWLIFTTF